MKKRAQGGRRLLILGCTAVALTVSTVACGSSGSSTSTPSGGTASSASKSAFNFYVQTQPLTSKDYLAGVKAAVTAINAAGGVDGRPLAYTTCDDNNDPNQAGTCARQAISNSAVLAFVASGSSFGSVYDPLLHTANLANFGELPSTAADDTTKISFPLSGGTFSTVVSAMAATEPQYFRAKKIGVPYMGIPAGAQLPPFISQVTKPSGASVVGTEAIPTTATDYTSYAAAEIAANPGIVVDGQTNSMYTQFIKAVRQQGDNAMKFLVSGAAFDPAQVKSVFGDDPNLYLVDEFDHSSPGYHHFLADMAKYSPSYPSHNEGSLCGWIGVYGFARALKGIAAAGTVSLTRADIVNYLNKQTNFDVEGLTGGINYTKPNPSLGGTIPRIFNDRIWLAHAVDGKEVPVNGGKPYSMYLK